MPDLETSVKYVAAAYGLVWIAILVYVWLIGQKLGQLEAELDRLEHEVRRPSRPAGAGGARRRRSQGGRVNRVLVAGVSHHTAPLAVRERLALTPARTRCLVGGVVTAGDAAEAVAISTCNRTELYLVQPDAPDLHEVAIAELLAIAGEHDPLPHDAFYVHRGERALLHLYRVAGGMDSLVPGEAEVLGQVRESLALSRAENAVGPVLSRLFESAIETGRRIRTETAIGTTPASVGSVAAVVAREALDGLDDATVLLVGAGKVAELCAVNLLARGAGRVWVMNRTMQKAAQLADRFDGEPVPMDELETAPRGRRRRHLRDQRAARTSSTPSRCSGRWPSGPSGACA